MSINIYGQPIAWMVAEILMVPLVWGILTWALSGKRKVECAVNIALLLAAAYVVFYSTLLSRTAEGHGNAVLGPFQLLLAAIRENREIVRSLLLNALLFVPFGAGLANCLPQRLSRSVRAAARRSGREK